jgi:hypothetical protein
MGVCAAAWPRPSKTLGERLSSRPAQRLPRIYLATHPRRPRTLSSCGSSKGGGFLAPTGPRFIARGFHPLEQRDEKPPRPGRAEVLIRSAGGPYRRPLRGGTAILAFFPGAQSPWLLTGAPSGANVPPALPMNAKEPLPVSLAGEGTSTAQRLNARGWSSLISPAQHGPNTSDMNGFPQPLPRRFHDGL